MTKRAIFFGLACVTAISSLAYFNDRILRQTYLIGNHFPISVHGLLIFALLLNWLLWRQRQALALKGSEFAVIVAMTLAACCIPNAGLLRVFTTQISLPHLQERSMPGWQKYHMVDEIAPQGLLVDIYTVSGSGTLTAAGEKTVGFEAGAIDPVQLKIRITSGSGAGQVRRILSYKTETKTAELDDVWRIRPESGSSFELLANNEDKVLTPFIQGRASKLNASSGLMDKITYVPWAAWSKPLLFWVPIVLLVSLGSIALSLIVQKQWSDHEHLAYPLANMVNSFLPAEGEGLSPLLRDRKFWIALGVVLAVYLNNYVTTWVPTRWITIPTTFAFDPLVRAIPGLANCAPYLYNPRVWFIAIAIAYVLASDVSLSVGLAPYVFAMLVAACTAYGLNMQGGELSASNSSCMVLGSYLGLAGMILWAGRRFYLTVLQRAACIKTADEVPGEAIWGLRLFLLCVAGMTGLLLMVKINLALALVYVILFFLLLLVLGRVIAETGFFFNQCNWLPCGMTLAFFGVRSMPPTALLVMFSISAALIIDSRETLLPFMMNGLKLNSLRGNSRGRIGVACAAAVILALAVALPVTLALQYDKGIDMSDGWGSSYVPKFAFDSTQQVMTNQEGIGVLDTVRNLTSLESLKNMRPMKSGFVWSLLIGAALVVGNILLRQRFPKFPIHPILFIMWATYSAGLMAFSFLVGWLIKTIILKYGGTRSYQDLKPVFLGLAAGELVGCTIPILFGFIYYLVTGQLPKSFGLGLG